MLASETSLMRLMVLSAFGDRDGARAFNKMIDRLQG